MNVVHIAVGGIAIGLNLAAGLLGSWLYRRVATSAWFWRLLRAGQVAVVLSVVLGGVEYLVVRPSSGLHALYGALPILVAYIAEQLRAVSAEVVLASRGLKDAHAVGGLPEAEQRVVAQTILQREQGVMALAAIVIVVLLVRAATTAG